MKGVMRLYLTDEKIIELFFERNDRAVNEIQTKYGKLCFTVAMNILGDREDAEECGVEGFTLGMIGAVLAFGLEWIGYDYLIQRIGAVDSLQLFSFVSFQQLLIPMMVVFGGAGVFVGLVGSGTAIRKFMDV